MEDMEDKIFLMSPEELINAGYDPFGVDILKKLNSGELSMEEFMEMKHRQDSKTMKQQVKEFDDYLKENTGFNRTKRRELIVGFKKKKGA